MESPVKEKLETDNNSPSNDSMPVAFQNVLKVLHLYQIPLSDAYKRISVYVIHIALSILCFAFGMEKLGQALRFVNTPNSMYLAILNMSFGAITLMTFGSLIVTKDFEWKFFLELSFLGCGFVGFFVFRGYKVEMPVMYALSCYFFGIMSLNRFYLLVLTVIYFTLFGGIFVVYLIRNELYTSQSLLVEFISDYSSLFLPFVCGTMYTIMLNLHLKSLNKKIKAVEESISNLNFQAKPIQEIMNKKSWKLTSFEKVIKTMLKNVEDFNRYLPEFLKDKKKNTNSFGNTNSSFEEDDSDFSDSSIQTISTINEEVEVCGMKYRAACLAVLGVTGEKNEIESLKEVMDEYEKFLKIVIKKSKIYSGMVYSFRGLEIVVAFNCFVSTTPNKEMKSVNFAYELKSTLEKEILNLEFINLNLMVFSDVVLCGDSGTKDVANFTIISEKLKKYQNYVNKTKIVDKGFNVFIENSLEIEAKYYYDLIEFDIFEGNKIFRIDKKNDLKQGEEWIYQIQKNLDSPIDDKNEVIQLFKVGFNYFENGKLDEAKNSIEEYLQKIRDDDSYAKYLLEKIKKKQGNIV